jgi:hypothetical protein
MIVIDQTTLFDMPDDNSEQSLLVLDESARWKARDVSYWEGTWDRIQSVIPEFETGEFKTESDSPPNPYMRMVVRKAKTAMERPMPVGVVSNTYTLAQHSEVGERCFEGIRKAGIDPTQLRCQIGLTQLGEWMNLRIYFPEKFQHKPSDGKALGLRLECFNSVDGSSRLVLLLGWLRFVCSNGLVIGETKAELKDIHNKHMNLDRIPSIVEEGLGYVQADLERLNGWDNQHVEIGQIAKWADTKLSDVWGKKAACRTYHICRSGQDVEIDDPFAKGEATEKPIKEIGSVPGAAVPAKTLYDVSQALSWVATRRNNADQRLDWQSRIPALVTSLRTDV